MYFRIVLLLCVTFGECRFALGVDSQIERSSNSLVEYVIGGMLNQRSVARSGVVQVEELHESSSSVRRQCSLNIAFDLDNDLLRFDRNNHLRKIVALYIRKPDMAMLRVLQNGASDGTITKLRPDAVPPISVMPFDIRCVGLTDVKGLEKNTSWSDVTGHFRRLSGSCHETEKNVFLLELSSEKSKVKLVVDESKGMAPLLFESGPSSANAPAIRISTSWTEAAHGVWVPAHTDIRSLDMLGRHATYDFNWKSVNEGISSQLLELDDFKADSGTLVVDRRVGPPVIESIIGGPTVSDGEQVSKRNSTLPLIIANIVLITLLVIAIYMKRRSLRRSN